MKGSKIPKTLHILEEIMMMNDTNDSHTTNYPHFTSYDIECVLMLILVMCALSMVLMVLIHTVITGGTW